VICPDKLLTRISTQASKEDFIERFESCPSILTTNNAVELGSIYYDSTSNMLQIERFEEVNQVKITSITGKVIQKISKLSSTEIQLNSFPQGIYLFEIITDNGSLTKKFFVR